MLYQFLKKKTPCVLLHRKLSNILTDFNAIENFLIPSWILNKKGAGFFANELLERVGLVERKDNFPSQLSGGEKARVALVRALINKPRLILADEPTGNLDEKNSKNLVDLLIKINRDFGQSIILTTHNPDIASIGDRQFILENGSLHE